MNPIQIRQRYNLRITMVLLAVYNEMENTSTEPCSLGVKEWQLRRDEGGEIIT